MKTEGQADIQSKAHSVTRKDCIALLVGRPLPWAAAGAAAKGHANGQQKPTCSAAIQRGKQ